MRGSLVAGLLVAACGGGSTPSGPDACAAELDADTLDLLTHSAFAAPVVEIQPGAQRDIDLGIVGLGGGFTVIDACATWSIAPEGAGAAIDPDTGAVTVAADAASNSRFVVTADVESGRKQITADVLVFRQAEMPWHGLWREQSELECGTGTDIAPESTLNEIIFWADGTLWVTWTPFELYIDYWGTHAFDASTSALTITPDSGNYVPADIDGTGTFAFDGNDTLVLHDMWLGSPQGGTQPARCGHRLTR